MSSDCIFCKIINGSVPSLKVYQDDDFLAFLDIRPLTKGNCLVIPKDHHRWVTDVPNFGAYWEVAKKVGLAAQKAFNSKWTSFLTLGLEVSHAHIRVIPRYDNDLHGVVVDIEKYENFSQSQMNDRKDKIVRQIGGA
jgi:histidine triad (HIT) family protein